MPDRFKDSHMRRVPLFSNLSDYHLSLLAQAFQIRRYNPGEFIFQQGEPTRGLHIFIDGQAVLYRYLPNGQVEQLGTYQNGQYINDAAIFESGTNTANLQAVRPMTALLLTRENMATLLSHYPELREVFGLHSNVQLKSQRENEEVFLKTRRHWWTYVRFMWLPFLIAIPLWIAAVFVPLLSPVIFPLSFLIIFVIGGYLYFEWANDSVTITDQRIVRITRTILTFKVIRDEIALESVQEANVQIPSLDIFARIFGYATISIKTAGKEGNLELDYMPNPETLQKIIMDSHHRQLERKQTYERQAMRAEVDRWISSQYQPQQSQAPQKPKGKVDQDKLEDTWATVTGPISPFVSEFKTDEGGVVFRKHWIVWLRAVLVPSLWLVAGLAVMVLTLFIPLLRELGIVSFAIGMVMLLIGAVWTYFSDWDWRHDYYVVTDNNIIIINQRPLWLQSENEQLLLSRVDNVVAESSGLWQRLLKYGDVDVALIGADQHKTFDNVAQPLRVQDEITRRQTRLKQQEAARAVQQQRQTIGEYLSLYHEAVGNNVQPDYIPPNYEPRPSEIRDRNRPVNLPRQSPSQPSMSEGRIYQPGSQSGYNYQYSNPASDYNYAPQQGQYPAQQNYQQGYSPQPNYPPQQNYPQRGQYTPQQNYQQPNVNPPLPQQGYNPPQNYAPQTSYPPQADSYTGQTSHNLPTQPNLKPTQPQQGQYPPQQNYQQPNVNPPVQSSQGYNPPPTQPNLNPPPPPPERDTGRPPKFPRRRSES